MSKIPPDEPADAETLRSRYARDVIDRAIAENRFAERLLYGFATLFVLIGVAAIIVGMVMSEGVVAVAGSIASALFYPAMAATRQIRKENIAIRLLEAR